MSSKQQRSQEHTPEQPAQHPVHPPEHHVEHAPIVGHVGPENIVSTVGPIERKVVPPHIATRVPGLTEGRIVHYVLPSGRNKGAHRPAIVVRDWQQANGLVQLQVFTDCSNDFEHGQDGFNGMLWAASVVHSEGKEPGSWHWIEQA